MTISDLNALPQEDMENLFFSCCGAKLFSRSLAHAAPFKDERNLVSVAEKIWYEQCSKPDWLEAFGKHPLIGDVNSLQEKFAGSEQASVAEASADVLTQLADLNNIYLQKFGFVFLIFATGKSASVMLRTLETRLNNEPSEELVIAAGEQHKITLLRFQKLLMHADWNRLPVSQLTTHVLDTSVGRPAENIAVSLSQYQDERWFTLATGLTNGDGRVADLLPKARMLPSGIYQLSFNVANYFAENRVASFYPVIEIQFIVSGDEHYHVPLLLNPYGYSTYRGS